MRNLFLVLAISTLLFGVASANTIESSTLHAQGPLTNEGSGVYTGTIPLTAGTYYVPGGGGAAISTSGGFDVYAKEGGCAYVQGYYGTGAWNCSEAEEDTYTIGSDHDAYPSEQEGGPWGDWYNPDCADWRKYSLELTAHHWYLRYTPTGESPMSGTLTWNGDGTAFAAETDTGTSEYGDPSTHGGGTQAWDAAWSWGVEVVPLELPGFQLTVTDLGDSSYDVTLVPAKTSSSSEATAEVPIAMPGVSVSPTSVDFGSVLPNSHSNEQTFTLTNTGNRPIDVTVSVENDTSNFYTEHLYFNDTSSFKLWNLFDPLVSITCNPEPGATQCSASDTATAEARIELPADYTGSGTQTGTIVFWAELQ